MDDNKDKRAQAHYDDGDMAAELAGETPPAEAGHPLDPQTGRPFGEQATTLPLISVPSHATEILDPTTGRPFGDHGTGDQAIQYALDDARDWGHAGAGEFLENWQLGNLREYPEYYVWLATPEAGQ